MYFSTSVSLLSSSFAGVGVDGLMGMRLVGLVGGTCVCGLYCDTMHFNLNTLTIVLTPKSLGTKLEIDLTTHSSLIWFVLTLCFDGFFFVLFHFLIFNKL